jgi:hypothetical protein
MASNIEGNVFMDSSDPIYQEFITYMHLSDTLIAQATKDEIAEAARILAMQAAHYARTFGELPIPELEHLLDPASMDKESVGLLRDGTAALVGVLATLTSSPGDYVSLQ